MKYKDEAWLREQYWEKRLNIPQIAKKCNVHQETISRWMRRLDVPRRSRSEVTKMIMEDDEIRRRSGDKKRKYHWNEHFFDKLIPDSAYIIGFMTADGWLSGPTTNRVSYRISIAQKERKILDKISDLLCYNGPLHKVRNTQTLNLWSKYTHNVLSEVYEIPIGRGKSYTVQVPKIILESSEMLPHYIRGIFDGDGNVDRYGRGFSFYSGSYDLLDGICNVLVNHCGLERKEPKWSRGGYIKKNGEMSGSYYINWWGDNSLPFAQYIYGENLDVFGSNLFLEAKRARFELAFRQ